MLEYFIKLVILDNILSSIYNSCKIQLRSRHPVSLLYERNSRQLIKRMVIILHHNKRMFDRFISVELSENWLFVALNSYS